MKESGNGIAKEITIGTRKIGSDHPCFIIAEVSCNHQQKFDQAVEIIKAAVEAGADAVKLQTYTPDTMTIDSDKKWFFVAGEGDNPDSWKGKNLYNLYKEAYTPWDWQPKLKKIAEELGVMFLSTPFDLTAVDFLEKLDVPAYKISAYESTFLPLLERVSKTKKPIIMSVGFATVEEIELSVKTLRENGAREIVLLHCTTSYKEQADKESSNLRTMLDLKERFNVASGFSDNMGGIDAPILAAAMGACIIEKHIVLKHDEEILDDRFSLDKEEFAVMVQKIRRNEELMGKTKYGTRTDAEAHNKNLRRSIFAIKDIKCGEKITSENIGCIRPAYGLETKYWKQILGKKAATDIEMGTPLDWNLVK
ncbi:pseudaminic acid synthase [Candidatus Micrarchaeota archaeon]|nr:pseudaminic acid synthase [Candidatus Micrarchaeota archaeon]